MLRAPSRPAYGWLALALWLELVLALVDGLYGDQIILSTTYLVVPLALAIVAGPREVGVVGAVSVVLSFASGKWDDIFLSTDHVVRLILVLAAGVLAVLGAKARQAADMARQDADEARAEADAARRRLDAILGALAEAVTVHDAHGKTIYGNDAALRLLGRESLDELLAAQPGELAQRFDITREDGSGVGVEDLPGRRAVRGEVAEPLLTRSIDRASGRERWLITKATTVRDIDGELLAVNIIEDVTAAKEAERRQRFLADAGHILAGSLDPRETMERVAHLAVPELADWCTVDVVQPDGKVRRTAIAHADPAKVALGWELAERFSLALDRPTGVGAVLRTGEPELHPELSEELLAAAFPDPEQLEATLGLGMRSAMLVPMRAGDRTLGVMTFASAESRRTFDETTLALATDIAQRAAAAIENALLYSERDQAAATLQASLLPETLPRLTGWDAAAVYRPGEEGSEIGGDFYDLFEVHGGLMVVLGDVTGKGVQAAALTALSRHTARTAARFDPDPGAVLRVVDEVLREQPGFALVTVVCAVLRDAPGGGATATIARAGHPSPLLVTPAGDVTPVGAAGILLGAVPDADWMADEVAMDPGDVLVFYTDGVADTPGETERFGDDRLIAVAGAGSTEPTAILKRIDEAVTAFQDGALVDDRALLAIRRLGQSGG